MSTTDGDEQQAAATSAFLAAMQQSHHQLQQQHLQPPPARKREHDAIHPPPHDIDPAIAGGAGGAGGESSMTATGDDGDAQSPPRKAPRKSTNNNTKDAADSPPTGQTSTDNATPAGPPYICPTCQTSYSRLEYLRRHERRHQDIRPFVCECGKGFSRSDVLSRHKRQCHYHLTGEQPSAEAVEAAAKKTRKPSMAKSRKKSQADATDGDDSIDQKSSHNNGKSRKRGQDSSSPPPAGSLMAQPGSYGSSSQPGPPPPFLPQNGNGAGNVAAAGMALPPPPPFYNRQQHQQHQQQQPPSQQQQQNQHQGGNGGSAGAPTDSSNNTDYSRTSGFMSAIHHALNNFGPSHHTNYPPSPESNASINSRNSSPRLHYRDAIPYTQRSGSTGSSRQSSLRKGTLDPYHAPPLWEPQDAGGRSSPAPGSASSSRHGSVFGGGSKSNNAGGSQGATSSSSNNNQFPPANASGPSTTTAAPAFSYPANEFASATQAAAATPTTTSGPHNQTLAPASDSTTAQSAAANASSRSGSDSNNSRFAVSTGPLSPFSGMGLSSISPYLSAFSNARDTPLVSSPGRGIGPGTPTSSLNTNVFDYTMRPPAKPASNTTPGKGSSAANASSIDNKGGAGASGANTAGGGGALSSIPLKRKESMQRDEPTTPSASIAMSATESGTLPALADFIDDQQRNAANGLLTLLGGGGAETPSRFVRGEGGSGPAGGGNTSDSRGGGGGDGGGSNNHKPNSMDNNPGTTSANPSSNPFFESAVTPGPEAFFLRLQGGEQERRAAGFSSLDGSDDAGGIRGQQESAHAHASFHGPPTSVLGTGLNTPGIPTSFDFSSLGGITPGQSSSGMNWLMSPSVQALISSFASPSGSGDSGSYFPSVKRNSVAQTSPLSKEQVVATDAADGETKITNSNTKLANGLHLQSAVINERIPGASVANDNAEEQVPDAAATASKMSTVEEEGEEALEDVNNPFYIPKHLFRSCYAIPHWELPPLTRLSVLAMHAQQNLLKHVPILHEPTFRIDTTPGVLAFAACMLGSHEAGRRWWAGEEVVPPQQQQQQRNGGGERNGTADHGKMDNGTKGASLPDAARAAEHGPAAGVDEQDGQELVKPIVMTEKMDMLMRSFATRCSHDKDKVPVVQALMLFQINNLLSSDARTRAVACISHGSVVSLARKAGLYDVDAPHVSREIYYTPEAIVERHAASDSGDLQDGHSSLPSYIASCSDADKLWRQWCEYEGRRRTAFIVLLMDLVASLDARLPALVELEELQHLPLPVPDVIWRSKDAESFQAALKAHSGITFGEAMRALLCDCDNDGDDDEGCVVAEDSKTGTTTPKVLLGTHGPFARLMMLLPILRGIVHLLQGRMEQAPTSSPLDVWLQEANQRSTDNTPLKEKQQPDMFTGDWQVELFKRALSRWRTAWDADESCLQASSPLAQAAAAAANGNSKGDEKPKTKIEKDSSSPSPDPMFTNKTASGATPLCEDALPFYWLSHVLLGHATSRPVSVRSTSGAQQQQRADNGSPTKPNSSEGHEQKTAMSTTDGDGLPFGLNGSSDGAAGRHVPDFRSMLRFAKLFVNSGEGTNGSAGAWGLPLGGKTITTSIA